MISANDFLEQALQRNYSFYTGVPCTFLTPLINRAISDSRTNYIGATSEGEAVAMAAGSWLAGKRPIVMCQNSGLGNMVNPLTSLNYPFRIPLLLIVTWRGHPSLKDEPQHELMGRVTQELLSTIAIRHRDFPRASDDIAAALDDAESAMSETSLPFCLVMQQGDVADSDLLQPADDPSPPGECEHLLRGAARPTRISALEALLANIPEEAAVVATTGKCGRELFTLKDRPQHLYLVGSMGAASAVGFGVALGTHRRVIVLDGDGAALMKLGNMATIGNRKPKNFLHIILDNQGHDSTGGQATVSSSTDFTAIAVACGYRQATACDSLDDFCRTLQRAVNRSGPELIHLKIEPGSIAKLGRPTVAPHDIARRFKSFLAST